VVVCTGTTRSHVHRRLPGAVRVAECDDSTNPKTTLTMTAHDDDTTPAGRDGAVSIRLERDATGGRKLRAHAPSALIIGVLTAFHLLGGSQQATIEHKLDELNTRVSRIEGALGVRTASLGRQDGGEGAGGTGANTQL
jgi:hypothetical protein